MNKKFFKQKFNEIFQKIKPGLEEGKRLYEDGLLMLSEDQLKWLFETHKKEASMLVLLTIVIQAYPGDTVEWEEDEGRRLCNILIELIQCAICEKNGFVKCHTTSNKISDEYDLQAREDIYQHFLKEVGAFHAL